VTKIGVANLRVTPLTAALGAELDGIDLAGDLDESTVTGIRRAVLDHKVVFFRDQTLDPRAQTRLAGRFGQPTPAHPVEPSVDGHPEVLSLDSDEGARADVWHSDLTFQPRPPMGAILHAVEVPEVGGDTLWADMAAAYQALSATLREFLDGLTATHSPGKAGAYFASRDASGDRAAVAAASDPVRHPVVRVHPETGARSLFVNPLFTIKVDGLRTRESDALLGVVQEVATQPEHVVRWHWRAGDVAFWDNRCTMHYALLDYHTRRRMERVALDGDAPTGVADARR
jgi:alpha-ketoglutarate-dependent taurine dioxygenase